MKDEEIKNQKTPLIPSNEIKYENENSSNKKVTEKNKDDREIKINMNENSSISINFFTFCGKKRRYPSYNDQKGFILTLFLFTIGTLFYEIMLIELKMNFEIEKKNLYMILIILSIITFIITIISFLNVSTSIPGYQKGEKITEKEFASLSPTKTIKNQTFILKYCHTCKLIRDIRTFHCKFCGICIERHDHHCTFISNCIGKKNLKLFFYFLIISFFHLLPIVIVDFFVLIKITQFDKNDKNKNYIFFISFSALSTIVFGIFFIFFILTMIITHIQLISKNQTSNEILRHKDYYSVFNKGCLNNWKEIFCEN